MSEATVISCCKCGKVTKRLKRLPRGWKHKQQEYYCDTCWGELYILRAVVIPVVAPVGTWEDLNKTLHTLFAETTRASNWMTTRLLELDVKRESGVGKMPSMPRTYLYPEARLQFPSLAPQSVVSLEQAVTRKYKSKRYDVVWRCAATLATYRYPQPIPIHNQSWSASIVEDRPHVSVNLQSGNRVELILKGGFRYKRQLGAFQQMISGEAQRGELSLYRQGPDLLCKMVAWLPKRPAIERSGTLYVRTDSDCLLLAANQKDEKLWKYNADHIRRWIREHARQIQRWSEDQKFENRPVAPFQERRERASVKYHHRLQTAADQAAYFVVRYANRRKFQAIEYNDSDLSYLPEFVWGTLGERIKQLASENGIEFYVASGDAAGETA